MSKYIGDDQHGYWWLHYSGQLRFNKSCHGLDAEAFFKHSPVIKYWYVQCELDWYRMLKESNVLREGPIGPAVVA